MTTSFNPITTPTPTSVPTPTPPIPTTTTPTDLTENPNTTLEPLVASVDSGPVQAYAKLEGDDFCYYIRTLQVTLGRRVSKPDNVDIPLGNTKSVSRQHASLFYNFTNSRFEMIVHGKNGAFVNEQFIEKGVTVPLENKTKIQIGEMSFVFLLPRTADGDLTATINTRDNNDFGYISTPHQLEKKSSKEVVTQSKTVDFEGESSGGDSGSESSEAYHHNKDIKPPYSYASLIAQAINSSNEKKMTLNGIYNYITTHFPYYQMTQNGWQNSIRHNLSLNKAFIKVPRGDDEPGKGAFWTIDLTAETQFTNGVYKRNKRTAPSSSVNTNVVKSSDSDQIHQKKRLKKDGNESEEGEDCNMDSTVKIPKDEGDDKHEEQHDKQERLAGSTIIIDNENETPITENLAIEANNIDAALITAAVAGIDPSKNTDSNDTTSTSTTTATTTTDNNNDNNKVTPSTSTDNPQNIQVQLQLQLQNTIRQHLLDPTRYPLPSSIAQLLPQAIAQLPPQLANQLTSTLQSTFKTNDDDKEQK